MVGRVYTTGELSKMLGLDRNRIRRAFKRIVTTKGLSLENFVVKDPRLASKIGIEAWKIHPDKGTILIPSSYLKQLAEFLSDWELELSKNSIDLEKLRDKSVLKGEDWGILVFYDNRKRKIPVTWKIEDKSLKIGMMVAVSAVFHEQLEKFFEKVHA